MDEFVSIDWTTAVDDIVDNQFVDVKRLENESATFNLIHGSFVDPSRDLWKDYIPVVTPEDIQAVREEAEAHGQRVKDKLAAKTESKKYIPGILKSTLKFPRPSNLSIDDQALCLKILLNFSQAQKPGNFTAAEKKELNTYISLKPVINQEQEEFLDFAKKHWDGSDIKIVREDLINLKWETKLKKIQQLPQYYTGSGIISFTRTQEINLNFSATVFKTGLIPRIILPTWKTRCVMRADSPKIEAKYFSPTQLLKTNCISQDERSEMLAKEHEVDLVISLAGLNCIATNVDPSHASTWILPTVIKEINGRNVVFVDKPLPPTAKNARQKNTWIYKYILKNYVVHPGHLSSIKLDGLAAEDLHNFTDYDDIFDEQLYQNDPDGIKKEHDANQSQARPNKPATSQHNVQYNLFNIGACGSAQNELMKDKINQDYKILVRTKVHGVEKSSNGELCCVHVAPKLEHQTALAFEAVPLEEAARQWISLKFTPDTSLVRARIDAKTSEFLQFERRTSISVNNELMRLYNVHGEDVMPLLYNIIDYMKKLTPGHYLLRHTAQNGPFATVYRETPTSSESSFDLQSVYSDPEFKTIPNVPWPILDKTVPTPAAIHFKRMPAMFFPPRKVLAAQKRKLNAAANKTPPKKRNLRPKRNRAKKAQ